MRCDWRNDPNAPMARIIDLDTGEVIRFCAMADEETGEYEQYRFAGGKLIVDPLRRCVLTVRGKARLKIEVLDSCPALSSVEAGPISSVCCGSYPASWRE